MPDLNLQDIASRHRMMLEQNFDSINEICGECNEFWPCDASKLVAHARTLRGEVKFLENELKGVAPLRLKYATAETKATELADALMGMVCQYMHFDGNYYSHDFMSAGETTTAVLVKYGYGTSTGAGIALNEEFR